MFDRRRLAGCSSLAPRSSSRRDVLLAGGMIGLGLTDLGVANAAMLAPPGPAAMAVGSTFMLLAGFPVVSAFAARDGLLQTLTADAFRGRVFGALGAIQGLAILVGLTLGAVAIDAWRCARGDPARRCGSSAACSP